MRGFRTRRGAAAEEEMIGYEASKISRQQLWSLLPAPESLLVEPTSRWPRDQGIQSWSEARATNQVTWSTSGIGS